MDAATLHRRISRLAARDTNRGVFGARQHGWALAPPWRPERLRAFEARHGVTLPHAYRTFLLEIAAGGAGPGYGLWEPGMADFNGLKSWEGTGQVAPLAEPFPYTGAWNLDATELRDLFSEALDEDERERRLITRYWAPGLVKGALPLGTAGCAIWFLLVVTGEQRGRIWIDDRANQGGVYPEEGLDFDAWYLRWLQAAEAELERPPLRPSPRPDPPSEHRDLEAALPAAVVDAFRHQVTHALATGGVADLGEVGRFEAPGPRAFFHQGPALSRGAIEGTDPASQVFAAALAIADAGAVAHLAGVMDVYRDERPGTVFWDYLGREQRMPGRRFLVVRSDPALGRRS